MSSPTPPTPHGSQPSLAALTAKFLNRHAADPGPATEGCLPGVEPHEAASGFRTEARTTWADALAAVTVGVGEKVSLPAPAAWASVTRQLPSRSAVALCVGNYPQLLGDLSRLFAGPDLSRPAGPAVGDHLPDATALRPADRSKKIGPEMTTLLVATGHRMAGDFATAAETLGASESAFTGRWRDAWENERAALLWESGRTGEAVAAWRQLPDGAVKSFNLGMAELFAGNHNHAQPLLSAACDLLPETSGWAHLAGLYLAVCEQGV